jgi:cytochrome o ubiquinol oxidase subunit 3
VSAVAGAAPAGAVAAARTESAAEKAFGFWIYLMSDAVIFALLFATYIVMTTGTAGGPTGHELFSLPRAFGETMLLLFSSTTFGVATVAVLAGNRGGAVLWLLVTVLLGLGFVALELQEFTGMISAGAGPDRSGFLSSFFTLVGTHGLHVSVGIPGDDGTGGDQGANRTGVVAAFSPWPLLALPRHRVDRHLFHRLPAGGDVTCRP